MQNSLKVTKSGAGVASAAIPSISGTILVLLNVVGDTTVPLDADVYLIQSASAPSSIPTTAPLANHIAHVKCPVNDMRTLDFKGVTGGYQMAGGNLWLAVNFNDTGTVHEVWGYFEQV